MFYLGETLISFITCRHSAAVWRPPQKEDLLLQLVFQLKSCTSVQCFLTFHRKTSYETVTFEIHHSKNCIKIDVLTSGCSHGSSLCGVIFIKLVKTLVKTVSELKGVFRWFLWCHFCFFLVLIYHSKTRIKIVVLTSGYSHGSSLCMWFS